MLQDQVCDEPSAAATSDGLDWAASFQSDFANTTFSFEDGGSVRFGNLTNFDGTAAIDNSHCRKSQIVSQAMPPVAVPSDSLFAYVARNIKTRGVDDRGRRVTSAMPLNVSGAGRAGRMRRVANNTNYLTVSLFRPDGTPYPVRNLSDSQRIYFSQPMPDCNARMLPCMHAPGSMRTYSTRLVSYHARPPSPYPHTVRRACAGDVTLLYWNTTFNDWDVRGVFRDDDLMPADNCTFVGYTLHLTTFAIGKLVVAINTVDPTQVRDQIETGCTRLGARAIEQLARSALSYHIGCKHARVRARRRAQDAFLLEGLGSTRGSIMTLCALLALIVTFFMCLYFTLRVRAHARQHQRHVAL